MKTRFLFPHRFKKIGWILFIPSLLLGICITFFNFEIECLKFNVFTIWPDNIFNSNRSWMIINNITDELTTIIFVVSAMLVAFSKEKEEDEYISKIRLESLVWATYINFIILLIGTLFIFDYPYLKLF
jgi:hypothetical protein